MTGFFSQLKSIFSAQANSLAQSLENPPRSLDYSLVKLSEDRRVLSLSLIDVSAARRRLEAMADEVAAAIDKYHAQVSIALEAGREDLARIAVERKHAAQDRLESLEAHIARIAAEEAQLKAAQKLLDERIHALRARNEELKSVYTSTRAQLRVRETLSGLSSDLAGVGSVVERAEARIQEMTARASAIDHLSAEGFLPGAPGQPGGVEQELNHLRRQQAIEEELARLRLEPPKDA